MAAALAASTGDIVAFLDADVANTTPAFVTGTARPAADDRPHRTGQGLLHAGRCTAIPPAAGGSPS